jgi:putative endopeptidase
MQIAIVAMLLLGISKGAAGQSADSKQPREGFAPSAAGCGGFSSDTDQSGHGFDLTNLDRSVAPCDDFFHFAAGGWIKNNPIPPAYSRWGSFPILRDKNEDVLHSILEEASKDKNATPGSNWQKVGDFYASCMDESQIESAGLKPLDPEFKRIAEVKDVATLQAEIARLQRTGANAVFGFGSEPDFKNSAQMIAGLGQAGLGLPDRDYYTREEENDKKLREAYLQHVTNMFKLLGDDSATAAVEAKTVISVETLLAKASMQRVDLRDPDKVYHKMPVAKLHDLAPNVSWESYFKEVGAPTVTEVNVGQPDFFTAVNDALTSVPLADWKTYMRWQLVHSVAPALPAKFVEENFNFYGQTLEGQKEMLPRWRRCVQATDRQLGEALGQVYVQRAFPPEAKAHALAIVKNLIAALRDDLSTLDWMGASTREQALKKLAAMQLKIGYPDKWRDYTSFHVDRGPYVENVRRGYDFENAFDVGKIGKPMDRGEWTMTPPTVNAYYSPLRNEIVFPAGILQPPFYDPNRDDAINYGAMGAVIGHELTHGFDDQGAKFDAQGNLKNWWTDEDLKNFQARGDCIVKQFDSFEVLPATEEGGKAVPALHENGKLVEGESIADLGGLTIAYNALQKSSEGKPAPAAIDGFTADQRFFLGWAQVWEGSTRPERMRQLVNTDPHPVDRFRVNGPMSNMPAFAKAFGCSAESAMVRPEGKRCRIW